MKAGKALRNKLLPHSMAAFQWALLVVILAFNMNFSIGVTGAVANGGLKVIMLFPFWMLISSIVLSLVLYRMRNDGTAERSALGLSLIATLFSIVTISLHFVDDFVSFMKAAEVIAWVFYNGMVSVSSYKISVAFLFPILRRYAKTENEAIGDENKSWA